MRIHSGRGYWCKSVKGKLFYFGKVADDPNGVAALEEWAEQKENILRYGEKKQFESCQITVAELCNAFLSHHEQRLSRDEISPRTFHGLVGTCKGLVNQFGRNRAVPDLGPNDFGRLKDHLAFSRGSVSLRNEMQRIRSVFLFAFKNGLIEKAISYGTKFDKPKLKQLRRERREIRQRNGKKMFEAEEIQHMLGSASQPLTSMILLAINCGMGQSDLANMPAARVNLTDALIDYPRPKTEAERICPLWDETCQAIEEWLPNKPAARSEAESELLFVTCRGNRFVKVGPNGAPIDGIQQEFNKVLRRLDIKRRGVGFYALRHSFRTIADATRDPVAINLIMGHTDNTMGGVYREEVAESRLRAVADHVHGWLFSGNA